MVDTPVSRELIPLAFRVDIPMLRVDTLVSQGLIPLVPWGLIPYNIQRVDTPGYHEG